MSSDTTLAPAGPGPSPDAPSDEGVALGTLFHQLNNQLGTGLAHAELIELKAVHGSERDRARQVIQAVLGAMITAYEIRERLAPGPSPSD